MCGLVGIAGDLAYKDELLMKRLLILDYFRGTDSTGMAAIRQDKSTVLAKAAVNPITFFDMKSFEKALDGWKSTAFIGHNRAATLGAVNDLNAHPYQFGNITGAHNGTLDKPSWQRLEFEAGTVTNTDSAAVFACINEIGIDDTIKLMEKGRTFATGAWALVWYDKNTNTINFIRNEHRPLWYAFNKSRTRLLWASEYEMLDAAVNMTKESDRIDWYRDKDGYVFFPFEQDRLYTLDLGDLVEGLTDTQHKKFKGRKIEGREPAPFVQPKEEPARTGGAGPWKKKETSHTGTQTNTSTSSSNNVVTMGTPPKKDDLDDDISDFVARRNTRVTSQPRSKDDPLNGYITEERFNELTKHGCSYCSADIDINDNGYTIYDSEDIILCSECSNNKETNIKLYLPAPN